VFRIVANTQTSMGATGYTTGLAPSMSLGCGAYAGNITSDNITPLHLINVKRLAYELPRDAPRPGARSSAAVVSPVAEPVSPQAGATEPPLDFVAEDDVRRAIRDGRRLRLSPRAIVTPAARDLAEGRDVLLPAGVRG
jgi:acetaldehyde dehydrogenase (acetylating)